MSFIKNNQGNLNKLFIIMAIIILLVIPLGIYALENSTNTTSTNVNSTDLNDSTDSSAEPNGTVENTGSMEIDTSLKNTSAEESQHLENETLSPENVEDFEDSNKTSNISETSSSEKNVEEKEVKVTLEISYPTKIIRSENFEIEGIVDNKGETAIENIEAEWVLPEDFEIVSGNRIEEINLLKNGEFIKIKLNIRASSSVNLGLNEIKLVLKNGE